MGDLAADPHCSLCGRRVFVEAGRWHHFQTMRRDDPHPIVIDYRSVTRNTSA